MKKAMIEVDTSQILNALEQLPQADIKKIIDTLFLKKLFKKTDFKTVSKQIKSEIKKKGVKQEVVEEAIEWARKQK